MTSAENFKHSEDKVKSTEEGEAQAKEGKALDLAPSVAKAKSLTLVLLLGILGAGLNILLSLFFISSYSGGNDILIILVYYGYFAVSLALSLLAFLGVIIVRTNPQKGARFILIPGVVLLAAIIIVLLFAAIQATIDFSPDYEGQTPLDALMEMIPMILFLGILLGMPQLFLIYAGLIARRRAA